MPSSNDSQVNFTKPFEELKDNPVYRVFSLEKFPPSLNENSMFFVKTKKWEDTFEAFLLKQLIWKEDGTENYPFDETLVENFYRQCCTYHMSAKSLR